MITKIPDEEVRLIAKGIKYPENEEWWSGNDSILESAIEIWKEASKKKRGAWRESPEEFYDEIGADLSDDGWDYIGPYYTYMSFDSIIKVAEAKYFGPTLKKAIIQSILDENDDTSDWLDNISFEIADYWQDGGSNDLRDNYKTGHVTSDFAEVMRSYENDSEAWEAINFFYDNVR